MYFVTCWQCIYVIYFCARDKYQHLVSYCDEIIITHSINMNDEALAFNFTTCSAAAY